MSKAKEEFESLPPEGRLGDQPVESHWHQVLTGLVRSIDHALNPTRPKSVGFIILMFPYGSTDGRCNYASNGANREDVVKFLREQADRFEEAIKKSKN